MMEFLESLTFLGLSIQAWITVITVVGIFFVMTYTRIPAVVAFLGALTILLVTGVVTEEEGMSGFGSEPVVVHAAFFVIIAGLIQTGVLYWLTKNVLGEPRRYKMALFRLMAPVSVLSAFLNAVNVVALFIDAVKIWAKKLDIAPSKLLMPLSFAASLGGMCTLLGNSSNLVVAGLYMQKTGKALNIFEPLLPGLVLTVCGIVLILLLQRFIPSRQSAEHSFETTSDYTVELLVPTDNPAVGSSVDEAGLYDVRGGTLLEIVRFDKEIIMPVPKEEYILGGDRLVYAGHINDLLSLKESHGLAAADHHVWSIDEIDSKRKMRTAYVNFGSDLIGQRMNESDFEKESGMVLVAVARQGMRVEGQPREIKLQAGDTLLLECPPRDASELQRNYRHCLTFFDSHFVPQMGVRTILSSALLVMMFLLSSFHVMPLMAVTMLTAGAMLLLKCCRMDNVVKYIDWQLLLVLGSTLVFSVAITKTGIANIIAQTVLQMCADNPYIVMGVMCLLASLVSEFVSDVGSSVIFFPIVFEQSQLMGCNPLPFVMSLMLSVTLSFSSPIGSNTHMLIYGPGSFKFTDFARIGIWMHLLLLLVCLGVVNLLYPLH